MLRTLASVSTVLFLSGCGAIQQAHMRMPPAVAEGQAVELIGLSGWKRDQFAIGEYSGHFRRADWTRSSLDSGKHTRGHYRFDIAGPEISGTISADCEMRQKEWLSGSISVMARPLAYRCSFLADGRAFPSRFELLEASTAVINRYAREGEIALGGETIRFRSVHELAGTPLPSSSPIGYVFEQGGVPVGAVELSGRPKLFTASGASPGARRTMTIATVAIALLNDPA